MVRELVKAGWQSRSRYAGCLVTGREPGADHIAATFTRNHRFGGLGESFARHLCCRVAVR